MNAIHRMEEWLSQSLMTSPALSSRSSKCKTHAQTHTHTHTQSHRHNQFAYVCRALSLSVPDVLGMLASPAHVCICMQVRFARTHTHARTHARTHAHTHTHTHTHTTITHCLSHRYPQLKNSRNELEFGYTVSRNFCLSSR